MYTFLSALAVKYKYVMAINKICPEHNNNTKGIVVSRFTVPLRPV